MYTCIKWAKLHNTNLCTSILHCILFCMWHFSTGTSANAENIQAHTEPLESCACLEHARVHARTTSFTHLLFVFESLLANCTVSCWSKMQACCEVYLRHIQKNESLHVTLVQAHLKKGPRNKRTSSWCRLPTMDTKIALVQRVVASVDKIEVSLTCLIPLPLC